MLTVLPKLKAICNTTSSVVSIITVIPLLKIIEQNYGMHLHPTMHFSDTNYNNSTLFPQYTIYCAILSTTLVLGNEK